MRGAKKNVALGMGLLLVGLAGVAPAAVIQPQSYAFSPATGVGTWAYSDGNLDKLTDGVRGGDDWTSRHEPWVGWYGIAHDGSASYGMGNYQPIDVSIDFDFAAGDTVGSVKVGTNQDAITNWNVVLPGSVQLYRQDGTLLDQILTPFSTANSGSGGSGSTGNAGRRHELVLSFEPVTFDVDERLQLVLSNADNFALVQNGTPQISWDNDPASTDNGMFWIFVDEVTFSSTAVPEPGTLALLSTGLPLLAGWRRRQLRTGSDRRGDRSTFPA